MKNRILAATFLACFLIAVTPQKSYSQSVYGLSSVGYDSNTREIFGLSATWLDYQLAWYYDPEVLGELYWQFNNEVPLDSGYGVGLSLPQYGILIPAVVDLYSTSYLPLTRYTTFSTHFIRSYYFYDTCSGFFGFFAPCYVDPFGFGGFFGGFFGPSSLFPANPFNPFGFMPGRRFTLGTTEASIVTPPGPFCLPSLKIGESMVTADGATAPACPTPTPTPTPTPITTILEITPVVLTPSATAGGNNTAEVKVRTVPATANRAVTITYDAVQDSGGHIDAHHTGVRPRGSLRMPKNPVTNAAGEFITTYTPSHIAGIVNFQATVAGGSSSTQIGVNMRVLDLVPLQPGANYELIGTTTSHPGNHFGTALANTGLAQIADDYKNEYYAQVPIPQDDKLHYNDQSIVWGGKFELNARWGNEQRDHAEHRRGINCDVRCCNGPGTVPQARWARLNQFFFQRGSTDTNDETQSTHPHWHLRFLFGAQNQAINRNAGHFVAETFISALEREPDSDEFQERMDTIDAAHVQGQTQTIDAAKALTTALFESVEYANRNRSDEEFVEDLYATYLLRAPEPAGYAFWLNILQTDNANGQNGRAHLIQGFVESAEFRNLIIGLSDTPAATPVCNDPPAEQSCYNQGGIWDPDYCYCTIEPDPDPCLNKPWLCDIYPIN